MSMQKQDYESMTGPELVSAYNIMATDAFESGLEGYRPVSRFMDKEVAVRRCEALASSLRARKEGLKGLRSTFLAQVSGTVATQRVLDAAEKVRGLNGPEGCTMDTEKLVAYMKWKQS